MASLHAHRCDTIAFLVPVHVVRCSFDLDDFANPSDPLLALPCYYPSLLPDFFSALMTDDCLFYCLFVVEFNWVNFCWSSFSQSGHSYVGCLARSSEKALHKSRLL